MAIANPLLLILGSIFVAIPIVLHLVMRRKPKHLIFPALRFVKQRRETNRRKLQLRHWLLLLLRCLAIFTLAAALARPSTAISLVGNWLMIGIILLVSVVVGVLATMSWIEGHSQLLKWLLTTIAALCVLCLVSLVFVTFIRGSEVAIGDRQAPVAAVFVIDTSPRMQYRQSNRTRLQQAKETANWLVGQLPSGSRVAVTDSRKGDPFFSFDIAAARKSIEVLDTTYETEPLVSKLEKSIRLAKDHEFERKEIYVVTDLTATAWKTDSGPRLKEQLEEASDVTLYLIDVGVDEPENFALSDLRLETESIPTSGELHLVTDIHRTGDAGKRTVELHLEKPDLSKPVMLDGKLQLPEDEWVRTATCDVPSDSSQQVEFYLGGLELGVHQGVVRIVGEDGLAIDDERFFTIEVKDAWPVLVVSGSGGTSRFLTEAIAPYELRKTGQASYAPTVIDQKNLANKELFDYAAVAILDPSPITPALWQKLYDYTYAGGGLAIFLGHNTTADDSFNGELPQKLLPGPLDPLQARSSGDLYLATPQSFDHPVTKEFRTIGTSVPWREFPIYRHWVFKKRANDTSIVFRYGNSRAAVVDREVGNGRVLTMTTPVGDPARPSGRRRWNDLPLGNAWPYFILVNEIFSYLVESGETKLNYYVGQTASLANDDNVFPAKYTMFMPSKPPLPVQARDGRIVVNSTKVPGAYRLRGSRGGPVVRGFSANISVEESDLTRADPKQLDEVLGEDRYKLARNREEIDRGQGEARVGREFYPLLVSVLAVVLCMEFLMANRFYRQED